MTRIIRRLATTVTLAAAGPAAAQDAATLPEPTRTGTVAVAGTDYHFAVFGTGEPLLLLHGGLGAIEMFGPVLGRLAAEREVIGVDLKGHGRSSLGDGVITLDGMGDDIAAVLDGLVEGPVDVVGYSLGGGVALQLAARHPEAVDRLVIASAPFARDGFYPEMLPQQEAVSAEMAPMMDGTPMHQTYMALAPNPDDFPRLLDAMGTLMRQPYDYRDAVATLNGPVMLVYGDSDMVRLDHAVEFYNLLGGGLQDAGWQRETMSPNRLAILPNLTHYEIFAAPAFAEAVLPFLNGEDGGPVWTAPGQ